jgi:hypothetical protein
MRNYLLMLVALPALVGAAAAGGQRPSFRTPDGHPDLQGTYDLGTLTPLERAANMPAVLSAADAAKLERQLLRELQLGAVRSRADRTAPPVGGDGSKGPAGNVGGYNTFWLDPGSHVTVVNGECRTSIVVDPADGRVPPLTAGAKARLAARQAATSDQQSRENDPGWEGAGAYDDPELRPLGERCLLGFGSTSGPPILPTYFYNNLHQIVQTRDAVMILTEMVHDVRIVRIAATHLPSSIRKWMGDSIGRWDGDTLVIDTTNFTDKTRFRGSTGNLHVVERLSRSDDGTLLYRFTIDDPATWATPWSGEYAWPATNDQIYEYACHEGNYALGNILRGARQKDSDDAGRKRQHGGGLR